MKNLIRVAGSTALALSFGAVAFGQNYTQVNLVSNTSGVAPTTDPELVNAWGISRGPTGNWWISDNKTGVSTLYAGAGIKAALTVTIPANPNNEKTKIGSPTGTIFNDVDFNSNQDFILSNGKPAEFLFSTLDGTIAGWNATVALAAGAAAPSTHAVTVVTTKDGSGYTGLTSSFVEGTRFLYAANFALGRVDVYDNSFHIVHLDGGHPITAGNGSFVDLNIPTNFAPFNVQAIGQNIVVTYAMHDAGSVKSIPGPGLGYVDIYSSAGQLLQRLDNGDQLNAPWGVALAPLEFGSASHELLIGQFAAGGTTQSAGFIAEYNPTTGHFDGLLKDASGAPIAINGLWDITFGNAGSPQPGPYDPAGAPGAEMFFSAGPNGGTAGLFGYLKPVSTDFVQGNDQ
ncbi:TIGR03118 family protein [Granulicella sp. dw_53]|uniref:TIGR03118 family protein n=1 Tax=Granulicella sp. dw_53 TaxID=2719792 RepID=UPI001BD51281|nr:TIGR03118 family protein [Granulicella sp. dw_53]